MNGVDWFKIVKLAFAFGIVGWLLWLLWKQRERLGIFTELYHFMRVRKKWWLAPILLLLVMLSLLIVLTQGSALAPFIYTLF